MSLIICPKHGESEFSLRFSKQIADAIRSNRPLSDSNVSLFKIRLVDDEDGEELYTETYLLLKTEFDQMNTSSVVSVDSEEEHDRYKSALPELGGLCAECFRAHKERHATTLLDFN